VVSLVSTYSTEAWLLVCWEGEGESSHTSLIFIFDGDPKEEDI
jgi:hypothetical protein